MKKVLITGVAGFIGHRLALQLLENQEVEVTGLDSITDYYAVDLKESRLKLLKGRSRFNFHQIDICDTERLNSLLAREEFDCVIHLAAQAGIRLPFSEYSRYVDSNLTGFSNILLLSAQHKVANFLYASSSSIYGNSINFPLSESELDPQPVSFYGSTKLSNEILARGLTSNSEMKTRGLRFFTVYGPMGRPDMAYFRIAAALNLNKTFSLFGDGAVKRDFTYVGDVVSSIISLCSNLSDQDLRFHDVVNVGGGRPCSMLDLVSTLENISGKKLSIKFAENIAQDVRTTVADTRLQKELIGTIPETSLEDGLREVWEWIENPDIASRLATWTSGGIH